MKRARTPSSAGPKPEHTTCNGTLRIECRTAVTTLLDQDWVVNQVGKEGDFEDGISTDSVDLVIHFRPPLSPSQLTKTQMAIHYTGRQTPKHSLVWCKTLSPLTSGATLSLVPDALEYRCWETYQLQLQPSTQDVLALYCSVVNVGTSAAKNAPLELQIQVDMKRPFMQDVLGPRGKFLAWFPPDVDPAQWGLRVDPRTIPQRTPLWFKLRGEVSGSRAYTLLGWYTNSGPMTAFQKGAMRLGTFSEDLIVLSYCYSFPQRSVREMGWCPAPPTTPLGSWTFPTGWGASPDGAVHDPDMSWDLIPAELEKHYASPQLRAQFDITRGGCEFKTSRTKLVVEPYFVAQVYMEMISLGVVWCDLVRYRPARTWDATKGAWRYDDVANVYRLFRDPALETRLVPLWKRAQANQHILERIIQEPDYVAIREEITELAAKQKPYHVIQVAAHLELSQHLQAYRDHAERACQSEELVVLATEGPEAAHWKVMEERMTELRGLRKGDQRFAQLIGEQIQALARLL